MTVEAPQPKRRKLDDIEVTAGIPKQQQTESIVSKLITGSDIRYIWSVWCKFFIMWYMYMYM